MVVVCMLGSWICVSQFVNIIESPLFPKSFPSSSFEGFPKIWVLRLFFLFKPYLPDMKSSYWGWSGSTAGYELWWETARTAAGCGWEGRTTCTPHCKFACTAGSVNASYCKNHNSTTTHPKQNQTTNKSTKVGFYTKMTLHTTTIRGIQVEFFWDEGQTRLISIVSKPNCFVVVFVWFGCVQLH